MSMFFMTHVMIIKTALPISILFGASIQNMYGNSWTIQRKITLGKKYHCTNRLYFYSSFNILLQERSTQPLPKWVNKHISDEVICSGNQRYLSQLENFARPLQLTAVPAFWSEPAQQLSFVPKIAKILPYFSVNFDYFLAQNCTRKLKIMLKTPHLL